MKAGVDAEIGIEQMKWLTVDGIVKLQTEQID